MTFGKETIPTPESPEDPKEGFFSEEIMEVLRKWDKEGGKHAKERNETEKEREITTNEKTEKELVNEILEEVADNYSEKLGIPKENMAGIIKHGIIDAPELFRPDLHIKKHGLEMSEQEFVRQIKKARVEIEDRIREEGLL